MAPKIDATRPFYAVVGAGDLAVNYARTAATDVQARFAKVERDPKALREQALTRFNTRVEELTGDAKDAQTKLEERAKEAQKKLEGRLSTLQADAKSLPNKVEGYVNDAVAEVVEAYGELAVRGQALVTRIRTQQATKEAKGAARSTVTRAKTAKTQTTKSARSTAGTAKKSAGTTKQAAKKTGATAKRSTKATTTSAKKAASSTSEAAGEAAKKVGD